MQLRVATWNLNMRTVKRPVRAWVGQELVGLKADVVVLTEYVPGREDRPLPEVLAAGAPPP